MSEGETVSFLQRVSVEVQRAERLHPPINSLHEGYAVILEEVDELWEEIKKNERDMTAVREELVQIAAMAVRTARNVLGEA